MNLAFTAGDGTAIRSGEAVFAADPEDATRVRAWTAFWEEQGPQSRCLADASPETDRCLSEHWLAYAAVLPSGAHVLDIGCGSGAVARLLASAQPHLRVVGVDSAQVPNLGTGRSSQVRIFPGVAMESLPFANGAFGAAVSQFGFEYCAIEAAARELARVLRASAGVSFIVHHSQSPVVRASRHHNNGLAELTGGGVKASFLAGQAPALGAQLDFIARRHPQDRTIEFAARCLLLNVSRTEPERLAIWDAVVNALAPDRTLSDALESCCVASDELRDWLAPLRAYFAIDRPIALAAAGEPLAWKIAGARRT